MKLFTVQGLKHWRAAEIQGLLTGGPSHHYVFPEMRRPYEWMRQQMKKRLPWTSGDYPVWAWLAEDHAKRFQPDARWGSVGEVMVEVGFEVPESRVLLSDFMAWHQVLNNDAIVDNDALYSLGISEETKIASWDRIFDPSSLVPHWSDGSRQACVDRVFGSEILYAKEFTIRPIDESEL